MKPRLVEIPVSEQLRNKIRKEKGGLTYEHFLQSMMRHCRNCEAFNI